MDSEWTDDDGDSRLKITGIKADPTQKEEFDADFDFGSSGGEKERRKERERRKEEKKGEEDKHDS
jgi:hypothetical protein